MRCVDDDTAPGGVQLREPFLIENRHKVQKSKGSRPSNLNFGKKIKESTTLIADGDEQNLVTKKEFRFIHASTRGEYMIQMFVVKTSEEIVLISVLEIQPDRWSFHIGT